MEEHLEPFSSDFSLGAWNDFGKFSDNGFGEGVECLNGVSLETNDKWDSYLGDGGCGVPHTEDEAQAPYNFISSTTEDNPSYEFEYSLEPTCFGGQSSLEELESTKDSNWTELMGQQVFQEDDRSCCGTLDYVSKNEAFSNCEDGSTSSVQRQVSGSTDSDCFVESNFSPSMIEDLKGSTSAQGRKMNAEERALMLYKRKLRNRESAAKTRRKRAKTLNQIGQELEELRQRADSLDERSGRVHKTLEENKKLVEENSHLRNVINQYAVELSTVRYKLKLYEDSADISRVGLSDSNEDVLFPSDSQKRTATFDASLYDQRKLETKKLREYNASKDIFAAHSNEEVSEMLHFKPFPSQVTTLDVLEQVSNQHLGNLNIAFSSRDRRRAIAATNVFLRERSMN